MRNFVLALAASTLIAACGNSNGGSADTPAPAPAPGTPSAAMVSCDWGIGTCDQYTGAVDATFSNNLQITCTAHGVAFATGTCPAANQVGHCDLGTTNGIANSYYYYSPTYDAATAQADCLGHGVGATWVP
jgi:hypothetical protein